MIASLFRFRHVLPMISAGCNKVRRASEVKKSGKYLDVVDLMLHCFQTGQACGGHLPPFLPTQYQPC